MAKSAKGSAVNRSTDEKNEAQPQKQGERTRAGFEKEAKEQKKSKK